MIAVMILFPTKDIAQRTELLVIGQSSPRSIIAEIAFDVPKNSQELEEELKKAREKVYPVFEYSEDTTKKLTENFELLLSQIETYSKLQKEIANAEEIDQNKITEASYLYQSLIRKISTTALNQLSQNEAARDTLKRIFNSMISQGVSNTLIAERNREVTIFEDMHNINSVQHILYSRSEVLLQKNDKETLVNTATIRPKEFLIDAVLDKYRYVFTTNPGTSSAFYEILYVFISPNIFYLETETEKRRIEAVAQVNPSKGMIPRGMEIISQGDIVTKETLERLEARQNALQKGSAKFFTTPYGQYVLLFMIVGTLCFYMWNFRPVRNRPLQIWAVAIVAIMQIVLFRLVHDYFLTFIQNEYLNPVWFYPFAFAPVLASVLFSFRTATALTIWSATLFGIFAGYDLSFCIAAFLISFAMSLIVRRIRYRVRFLQSLCAGLVIFVIALTGILLLRNSLTWTSYWQNILLGTANLLLCITFISVFCNVFERVFQITTNLRLAELSDFNHPLLRHLSEYAPGTFHHCIQVGNLGEIAGERIGANTLLIRVMSLYHDIGKTMRPEYFTENQRFGYNPHDNVSPYDSIKILRAHVDRGIEFAEEYNLPDPVAASIREHHGTGVAQFFYNKAKEMYPDREVKVSDFCYSGTIPQSKESAVVMLADSIEAISRSMQNVNPEQLLNIIQKTIEDKMFDGQLNDSGLTIRDLKELGKGFLQGLEGSTHSRVQYPDSVFSKKRGS
ncbi:MAG: HDIG domain-containing protein [Fibromonadaceae bacterium]|jgi:putative nucleotidyltransferase with HDIG domain|nr:HDIG domain-containing protein [Fibromonadaceae bacterium]